MSYYLIFQYNNLTYGLPAENIQEIFLLPQLATIPEAPKDIVGAVNLRGEIIPVMDLNLRFGYEQKEYSINDNIVILTYEKLKLGMMTNEVKEVIFIDKKNITEELSCDRTITNLKEERFISGMVQEDEELILLLEPEKLLQYTESQELSLDLDLFDIDENFKDNEESIISEKKEFITIKPTRFFANATEYERKVLEKRANNLRQFSKIKDLTGLIPISVFTLNNEYFGIKLSLVQEFIKFKKYTPIPCTPKFVLGNINLRGEIITLIDIRGEFNLSLGSLKEENQAVIVNIEGIIIGIVIDAINDIFMMNSQDLQEEKNQNKQSLNKEFLQGFIPYQDKMLGVIDLTEVILSGNLLVDEAV